MTISTAVDVSQVGRALGISTTYRGLPAGNIRMLPQQIAVIGQGTTAKSGYVHTGVRVYNATEAGDLYGYGSPIHLAVRQLFPDNGDGVGSIPVTCYGLDDDVAGTAALGSIIPVGATQGTDYTYTIKVNNIACTVALVAADTPTTAVAKMKAAINAVANMPVIATNVVVTTLALAAKWKGKTGEDLYVEVIGTVYSLTFGVTQPVTGGTSPVVTAALTAIGTRWETMVISCLESSDTVSMAAFSAWGEGRWGALIRKPAVVFYGDYQVTVAGAITVPNARTTDRTNCQLVEPGGNDLPCVVAARQVARIAKQANNNPPVDYGSLSCEGLTPGADGDQWDNAMKDAAVKGGSSTVDKLDGVVKISDVVTFYHPAGDPLPAYRYVVDIIKLQNILYNLDLIFSAPEWAGAPLVPDDQPTKNPAAKKPKMARAAICSMIDALADEAILSNPKAAKAATECEISSTNPKRLDCRVPVQLSGNTNIRSIDLLFGFYFGGSV